MFDLYEQLDADAELRLVPYYYNLVHGREPAGVWRAPGAITLFGDDELGLAIAARWGGIVAAEPRDDDLIELRSMNRPAERAEVHLGELAPGTWPTWAAGAFAAVWAMREADLPIRGTTLLSHTDLPPGAGLGASAAVACGAAMGLRDLYSPDTPSADLVALAHAGLRAFSGPGGGIGCPAGSLLGHAGQATVYDPQDPSCTHLPLDLAAAGLRLLVITPRTRHDTAADPIGPIVPGERDRVRRAMALLGDGDVTALGPLMSEAHDALRGEGICSPEQEVAVVALLEAGAVGARMTWDGPGRPVTAMVRAETLGTMRRVVTEAYGLRGWRAPRFLTATPVRGARRAA